MSFISTHDPISSFMYGIGSSEIADINNTDCVFRQIIPLQCNDTLCTASIRTVSRSRWGTSSLNLSRAYMNNTRRNGQSRISSTTDLIHRQHTNNSHNTHIGTQESDAKHRTPTSHIRQCTYTDDRFYPWIHTDLPVPKHSTIFRLLAHRHAVHTRPLE